MPLLKSSSFRIIQDKLRVLIIAYKAICDWSTSYLSYLVVLSSFLIPLWPQWPQRKGFGTICSFSLEHSFPQMSAWLPPSSLLCLWLNVCPLSTWLVPKHLISNAPPHHTYNSHLPCLILFFSWMHFVLSTHYVIYFLIMIVCLSLHTRRQALQSQAGGGGCLVCMSDCSLICHSSDWHVGGAQ